MSKSKFADLVERAMEELPEEMARLLEEVAIEVQEWPTANQLSGLGVAAGHTLLGLYQGRPRTWRSVEESGSLPDRIYIFQRPIEQMCSDEGELLRQVRTTVLHEIGHHFGLNEEDLARLGYR